MAVSGACTGPMVTSGGELIVLVDEHAVLAHEVFVAGGHAVLECKVK